MKDPSGNRTERWVSPKLSRDSYHAIIVDALKARIDEWAESAGKLVAERLAPS